MVRRQIGTSARRTSRRYRRPDSPDLPPASRPPACDQSISVVAPSAALSGAARRFDAQRSRWQRQRGSASTAASKASRSAHNAATRRRAATPGRGRAAGRARRPDRSPGRASRGPAAPSRATNWCSATPHPAGGRAPRRVAPLPATQQARGVGEARGGPARRRGGRQILQPQPDLMRPPRRRPERARRAQPGGQRVQQPGSVDERLPPPVIPVARLVGRRER